MRKTPSRLGIIPARAESSRFPHKIIARILNKPMIQYVWEAASRSRLLTEVLVATDHPEIRDIVEGFGGKAILTGPFDSGTDRVASLVRDREADIIVNLQGDEPLIAPETIDELISDLELNPASSLSTLAVRRKDSEGLSDPQIVKVVISRSGEALYFSRQPLACDSEGSFLKHIGIYAFRREALLRFCALPVSALEKAERLEQLRALENGMRIRVVTVNRDTIAVDIPEDIKKVEWALLAQNGNGL